MKKLNLVFMGLLFVFCIASCGGNAQKKAAEEGPSVSSTTATGNDASFSCVLDGKEISGKGTDQNINAAFRLTGDDKGQIVFRLSDLNDIGTKFVFQVPDKIGSTTVSVSSGFSYIGYTNSDMISYLDNPITINIASINGTRVAGTFSGTYTLSGEGNTNSKHTLEVTDGKFDIPFSTSADWKKFYQAQ